MSDTALQFGNRELVLVSNREPYVHERVDGEIQVVRPTGGLTSALDPMMANTGGTWVAWGSGDGDDEMSDENGCVRVPPESPSYDLKRVSLTDEQVQNYYYGYSNQVLWPMCHSDTAKMTPKPEFWEHYRETNEHFADAIREQVDPSEAVIWFQDYHFALAPRRIREECPDAFCMQFWHIPWPSWDVLQSCPEYEELLDGLLANDLLGFHTDRYCENFLDCVERAFDAEVDHEAGWVRYEGRTIQVESFPLGIDAAERRQLAGSSEADDAWESLRETYALDADRLAVGVDRLDYTKGIEQRLAALEQLWEKYPERRETFTYVQKASESRSQIDDYQRVKENVTSEVERINDRFGTATWQPIVYIDDHLSPVTLAALYRESDMVLVSSLRDGMNLVAKEFVASQVDDPGVLVLSELVGAHEALGEWAITVHPNDTEAFADSIEEALEMDESERATRMEPLRASVEENDIEAWKNSVLQSASKVLSRKETTAQRDTTGTTTEYTNE
ncbi:trehalose-6-phosphate synthase [Haladaptatus sp. AB643]|uniref:alpha,alpha-trehalose-phosphate synthase (UDP-forming) n=1 Tax=Haladaptatus sp. AB643 TaxID=2934174 RepID=UPI00209BEAE7|nr:trehalose-6-phosphate synthase [Haladaptatus sp. AB643]MCO8244395.1 trehalose-6-phosphate synthase [Haladaptatus sp. AB643]